MTTSISNEGMGNFKKYVYTLENEMGLKKIASSCFFRVGPDTFMAG